MLTGAHRQAGRDSGFVVRTFRDGYVVVLPHHEVTGQHLAAHQFPVLDRRFDAFRCTFQVFGSLRGEFHEDDVGRHAVLPAWNPRMSLASLPRPVKIRNQRGPSPCGRAATSGVSEPGAAPIFDGSSLRPFVSVLPDPVSERIILRESRNEGKPGSTVDADGGILLNRKTPHASGAF